VRVGTGVNVAVAGATVGVGVSVGVGVDVGVAVGGANGHTDAQPVNRHASNMDRHHPPFIISNKALTNRNVLDPSRCVSKLLHGIVSQSGHFGKDAADGIPLPCLPCYNISRGMCACGLKLGGVTSPGRNIS
jgi:hypothetical protein